jgi:Ca2+-transporting ATPase
MGITGTDVSKEVADMVLLDDNFATIVTAVEEGRVIYDNIRKFMKYLLTTNSAEIWVMLAAPFLGMPLPLLPLQILWINLVTDGLPALALGVEPPEPDTMRRPPVSPHENIFGRGMGRHILWVGVVMALLPLGPGYWAWRGGDPQWQTIVFTILTFAQMSHALAIRSGKHSLFKVGVLSNKPLLGAVLLTCAMHAAVLYIPYLQMIFKTTPLSPKTFGICAALSTIVFWAVELEKWFTRRTGGNKA